MAPRSFRRQHTTSLDRPHHLNSSLTQALFRSGSVPVVVVLFSIIGPSGRLVGPVARPVIGPVGRPGRRSERPAKDRTGHTGRNRGIVVVPSLNVVALGLVVFVI